MVSMFKEWCKEHGFLGKNPNPSHVFMDGGVLSVPFDRLKEFYEKYVECITLNEKVYLVEQKTIDAYNFFVDLDYKDDDILTIEEIKRVCKVICDKVSKYGGKDALVCVSKPKKVGDFMKTGVHINWPDFAVNRSSALALREHVINTLNIAYGSKDWNDIVDLSVYGSNERNTRGSGFRMPFSHKWVTHKECNGKGCSGCDRGKETQSEYLPILMYKHGPLAMFQNISPEPTLEIMFMATLRSECTEPNIIEGLHKKKEGSFTASQLKDELKDPETCALLETFIRRHMEGQVDARVKNLYREKNSYLVATTSRYCENTKRSHGSNHVWFHILGDTIFQKCFCRCETMKGRFYGFCKDFSGRRHQLPPSIVEKLQVTKYKPLPKKKPIEKPREDVREDLKTYIKKYMVQDDNLEIHTIENVKGKKKLVKTNHTCPMCSTQSDFSIFKNEIQKICKCVNRKHRLIDKIVSKL
jgi:hypothetical protein